MSTRVTSKGQVTIPKPIRDRLNIKAGNAVDFKLATDGKIVLVKAGRKPAPRRDAFDRIRGSRKGRMTTDEIMALLRGES